MTSPSPSTLRQQSKQSYQSALFYSRAIPSVAEADKQKIKRQVLRSLKQFFAYDVAANALEARG